MWYRSIALVAFAFVALYSYLPHKELRFVIYSIPLWNLISAVGLVRLYASSPPLPEPFLLHCNRHNVLSVQVSQLQ